MGDRVMEDMASNNVMDCVMTMSEVEEVNMDVVLSGETHRVGEVSPSPPILTVEKVLETFKRISAIKTPEINSKLAIPYKKQPVVNSSKWRSIVKLRVISEK